LPGCEGLADRTRRGDPPHLRPCPETSTRPSTSASSSATMQFIDQWWPPDGCARERRRASFPLYCTETANAVLAAMTSAQISAPAGPVAGPDSTLENVHAGSAQRGRGGHRDGLLDREEHTLGSARSARVCWARRSDRGDQLRCPRRESPVARTCWPRRCSGPRRSAGALATSAGFQKLDLDRRNAATPGRGAADAGKGETRA